MSLPKPKRKRLINPKWFAELTRKLREFSELRLYTVFAEYRREGVPGKHQGFIRCLKEDLAVKIANYLMEFGEVTRLEVYHGGKLVEEYSRI